jgi:MoaA/NifB/PqqE/SkfB family radical SAM enzyme
MSSLKDTVRPGNAPVAARPLDTRKVGAKPSVSPSDTGSGDLGAPLYVAWQITNECDLACMHCIEESGPGKAFKDELSKSQVFDVLKQLVDAQVPYMSFSGGEPMVHPHFFEMVEFVTKSGVQLKIETNGHSMTEDAAKRLKDLGIKAVQVSMDGGSRETFNQIRLRGDFDRMIAGVKNLGKAGVPIEINYSPTKFNTHEIGMAVDLAYELGAYSFYTGRTMYTGNAVKAWHKLVPTDEQYTEYFATLHGKTKEYEGRMRVYFHEMGLLDELRYRLKNPAALFIVLPNGLVKLINALPFVCGDLRKDSVDSIWANFQDSWKQPQVAEFVENMATDPKLTSALHKWVYL